MFDELAEAGSFHSEAMLREVEQGVFLHVGDYVATILRLISFSSLVAYNNNPDSKVHEANMGPTWGRQGPGGPHVGPMNFAVWEDGPNASEETTKGW